LVFLLLPLLLETVFDLPVPRVVPVLVFPLRLPMLALPELVPPPFPLTLLVAAVWGVTIVADSAQFSTAVTELSPPAYVGTALTTQTCAGFALTTLTIWLIPPAVAAVGWRWAFATLAVGPLLGVVAMARLRATPEAARLAGGRR